MRAPLNDSCITFAISANSVLMAAALRRTLRLKVAMGITQTGTVTSKISVTRGFCHSRKASRLTSVTGSLTIVRVMELSAPWRPATSLPMRDISSPVLVRWKKLSGSVNKCAKSRTRKSVTARIETHWRK